LPYLLVLLCNLAAFGPVWLGHWSVFALLGLYWFENATTGVIQYLKLRRAERAQSNRDGIGLSGFFAVHYGMFTFVHGLLVLVLFGFIMPGAREGGANWWWFSALMVASSLIADYRRRFVRGDEARHASMARLMLEPYGRVAVLHVVVIVGGWLALSTQQPRSVLLLLIGLKLIVELWLTRPNTASSAPREGRAG
jgi:hypothetical protein